MGSLSNLYFLKGFNPYYNRIVRRLETLEDYLDAAEAVAVLEGVNFNPNNGGDTEQLCDWLKTNNVKGVVEEAYEPDYLLVTVDNNIKSRWFVMEAVRKLNGMYDISLHRDIVVDHYNALIAHEKSYIMKGTPDSDSPLNFIPENGISVNQLYKGNILLKDKTMTSWIVGYYAKGHQLTGTVKTNDIEDIPHTDIGTTIENWQPYHSGQTINIGMTKADIRMSFRTGQQGNGGKASILWKIYDNEVLLDNKGKRAQDGAGPIYTDAAWWFDVGVSKNLQHMANTISGDIPSMGTTISNFANVVTDDMSQYNGQTVRTSDNKYYVIKVNDTNSQLFTDVSITAGALRTALDNSYTKGVQTQDTSEYYKWKDVPNNNTWNITYQCNSKFMTITEVKSAASVEYDIPASGKLLTTDAPYDMFAIPYGGTLYKNGSKVNIDPQLSMAIANDIITKYSGDSPVLYDIQLLPYCPMVDIPVIYSIGPGSAFSYIKYDEMSADACIKVVDGDNNIKNIILNCPVSTFKPNIVLTITDQLKVQDWTKGKSKKVQSVCDMWRIVSPNHNGMFEFDLAKNGGMFQFHCDCTYKPFQPNIHVRPKWGGIYLQNQEWTYDQDSRGLICGGEFGLPLLTSAWETYQRQNVNYNNIFDRQLQNMDVKHDIARKQDYWSISMGAVSGAVSGAFAGGMMGSPAGIMGGALVGAGMSLVGGLADKKYSNQLRAEEKSFFVAEHQLQLGNVQALPNSLTRISPFTYINMIFPYIEYYTCTDEEIKIVEEKLKYEGYTINAMGSLSEYIDRGGFIRAKLIRVGGTIDSGTFPPQLDEHAISQINEELSIGLYF